MGANRDYERKTRRSKSLYGRALKVFAGGVSHNTRFYEPYPLFVKRARGKFIWDEDGNRYTDYWMGHTALILGHSPKIVVDRLEEQVRHGTLYGMGSSLSVQLAEEVQRSVPCAEMVRFCNSGAEATMYLIRLARAYMGRRTVVKIAGGWHGYNTQLNTAVHTPFAGSESAGILPEEQARVVSIPFNDVGAAERVLGENEGDTALVFLEPVLGAGGCIPAEKEYLKTLRELTAKHDVLLAFDEIITGFRLALGGAQEYYGVKPDLASLGKIVGGGLPIGVVCGLEEIVSRADPRIRERAKFVSIGGGTFSENPPTMAAGLATLKYLRRNRGRVYSQLKKLGDELRKGVDEAFKEEGIEAHTTGASSLFATHFAKESPRNAEESQRSNVALQKAYHLALMAGDGIFVLPGHLGAISTEHDAKDLAKFQKTTSLFAAEAKRDHVGP